MTGIAEASLGQCSRFRPRFNEQSCFFSGILAHKSYSFCKLLFSKLYFFLLDIEAKSIWFFLPIGAALITNTVMFALTVKSVCALDKQARDLGITTGQRSKNMERYST